MRIFPCFFFLKHACIIARYDGDFKRFIGIRNFEDRESESAYRTGAQPALIDRFIMFARFLNGLDFPTFLNGGRQRESNCVNKRDIGSFFSKFHLPSNRILLNFFFYMLRQIKTRSCNLSPKGLSPWLKVEKLLSSYWIIKFLIMCLIMFLIMWILRASYIIIWTDFHAYKAWFADC